MFCDQVRFLLVFVTCVGVAFTAEPVGTITSSGDLTLSGVEVPAKIPAWPVTIGDDVVTDEPAVVKLTDGGTIALQANSRLAVRSLADGVVLELLEGNADYRPAEGSSFVFLMPPSPQAPSVESSQASRDARTRSGRFKPPVPSLPHPIFDQEYSENDRSAWRRERRGDKPPPQGQGRPSQGQNRGRGRR